MDAKQRVKIKKKLDVADLSGEKVMIDFETGKYFLIKGTGNDIWDYIQEDITVGEIIERLLSEYEVSREDCTRSVEDFLGRLSELEFI